MTSRDDCAAPSDVSFDFAGVEWAERACDIVWLYILRFLGRMARHGMAFSLCNTVGAPLMLDVPVKKVYKHHMHKF